MNQSECERQTSYLIVVPVEYRFSYCLLIPSSLRIHPGGRNRSPKSWAPNVVFFLVRWRDVTGVASYDVSQSDVRGYDSPLPVEIGNVQIVHSRGSPETTRTKLTMERNRRMYSNTGRTLQIWSGTNCDDSPCTTACLQAVTPLILGQLPRAGNDVVTRQMLDSRHFYDNGHPVPDSALLSGPTLALRHFLE